MVFDRCLQINLQEGFGGGEVYAAALARTLAKLGWRSVLRVHPRARAWQHLALDGVVLEYGSASLDLNLSPCWIVCHHRLPRAILEAWRAQGHYVTSFVHLPLYDRDPAPLRPFQRLYAVSRHVMASLQAAGFEQVHPEPLYGIAELDRVAEEGPLIARSRYDWDRRKLRDRLMGLLEPLWRALVPRRVFTRRASFTLGIVSRLTPIKQFPLLFRHLAPILARYPQIALEIFGSGGYASVRDLERALRPIANQVRFWGEQKNVRAVYGQIDALLTGLPEKEALGLNVLEAQACGVPVLAPAAPPFDETVLDGQTGLLYRDPRLDGGAGFASALERLYTGKFQFDRQAAAVHLADFSCAAFTKRIERLVQSLPDHRIDLPIEQE